MGQRQQQQQQRLLTSMNSARLNWQAGLRCSGGGNSPTVSLAKGRARMSVRMTTTGHSLRCRGRQQSSVGPMVTCQAAALAVAYPRRQALAGEWCAGAHL